MSPRTTIALLCTVVAVGLYIQFGERRRENSDERKMAARLAVKFDPDAVTRLHIDTPSGLFILERTNHAWRLTSPVQAQADASAVLRIIDTLAGLRKSEIITAEEMRSLDIRAEDYGFYPPRATISLQIGDDSVVMLIGRDSASHQQLYMKRDNSDDIIVTSRDILAALPSSVLDIRDRRLFNGQPGRIRRIELTAGDRLFSASRNEEDQWNIDRPVFARGTSSTIRQWLDRLFEFRIADFIADSVAAGSLYGFDQPTAQVSLLADSLATPQVLKIGRAADVDETSYYATLVGQDAVFTVSRDVVDLLKKDTAEFRDNRLLAIPLMNIGFIQLSDGERILQMARNTQQVWEVISPKRFVADEGKIQGLLSTWSGAMVQEFIDSPVAGEANFGISDASPTLRLAQQLPAAAPANGQTNNHVAANEVLDVTIQFGNSSETGGLFIAKAGNPTVMRIARKFLETFTLNPLDFRDPVILTIEPADIRRINQILGTADITVERTGQVFRAKSPQEVANATGIDDIVDTVSHLVAARLVEEDPLDLAAYGLDKPVRQVVLGLSGSSGINKVILIGSEAEPGETFVMIQGNDMVFTLPDAVINVLTRPVASPPAGPVVESAPEPE